MFVLLLTACADENPEEALARADAWLRAHPSGTAIVRASVGGATLEAAMGGAWRGEEISDWLAPCALPPEARFDAELQLAPGEFPWEVDVEPAELECVATRLATFPFDGPTRRGDIDVVRVRWRPGEPLGGVEEAGGSENGLRALAPPWFRWSPSGDALVLDEDLRLDGGRIRIRPLPESDVVAGPLDAPEAWARKLACEGDSLDLVRTVLVFADGDLEVRRTTPDTPCVEDRADEARGWLAAQRVGAGRIGEGGNGLVVLDVPVGGPWSAP